jgi:hypothetical protein
MCIGKSTKVEGTDRSEIGFETFMNHTTREPVNAEGQKLAECCEVVGQTQHRRNEILGILRM